MTRSVAHAVPNELLLYERTRRKLTQEDVAERLGLLEKDGPKQVGRWERGLVKPSYYSLKKLEKLYGRSARQLGYPTYGEIPFLYLANYPRNPTFTGRNDVLQTLHTLLNSCEPSFARLPLTLIGLPGMGKTHIAVEYAYQHLHEYHTVALIRAETQQMLASDFASLAILLNLPVQQTSDQTELIEALKAWLANSEMTRWLLIFDNLTSADGVEGLVQFLPPKYYGQVILTTRMQATGTVAQKIEVPAMKPLEGATLLLRRAKLVEKEAVEEIAAHPEYTQALALSEALGGLPLALDQAGAYVEENGTSVTNYLHMYHSRRRQLLTIRGGFKTHYPLSVEATFSIAFEKVREENPAAIGLLSLFTFFASDAIPEEVIRSVDTYLGSPLEAFIDDPIAFDLAMGTLRCYSLVLRSPETKTCTLHRLVQTILQDRMDIETKRMWAERAMLALNATFPKVEHKAWAQCERLLPHALQVAQHIEQLQITNKAAGRLLSETAIYLRDRSQYAKAELLFLQALQILERQSESQHLDIVTLLTNLVGLYTYQGKYEQGELLCKQVLQFYERQPEQPGREITLHTVATHYISLGKYELAEPLLLQALQIRKQLLGQQHSDVAVELNNLASLYTYQGKYELALPLFQQAQQVYEQLEHPYLTYVLSNLGELYFELGMYAQAEALFQRARQISERLGDTHHGMLFSLNGLANLSLKRGNYVEAEVFFQQALHICKQNLEPGHTDIAAPLHGLANLSFELGNFAEAEVLFQQALDILEQALGREQPEVAKVTHDFARLQQAQGNYEAAKVLYAHALAVRRKAFGEHHIRTNETRICYSALLRVMELYEEATSLDATRTA